MRALVVALGVFGASALFGAHAAAYSGHRDPQAELRSGNTLAIVTRTDHRKPPDATFRVDAAYGSDLPVTLAGQVDGGMSCQPAVFPDEVAAIIFEPRAGGWSQPDCSGVDFVEALNLVYGEPVAAAGGSVVAVATGTFGGSRLAGLDAGGRVVAWDHRGGHGQTVAVCPGGRTVVAYGRGPIGAVGDRGELSVHDSATLRRTRAVELPASAGGASTTKLRCADGGGAVVQALRTEYHGTSQFVTVDGTRVDTVAIPRELEGAVAVADGFLALAPTALGDRPPRVVRIGTDGTVTNLPARVSGTDLTVAPDGVTVAAVGHLGTVFTFDARTGAVLGRWRPGDQVVGAAWTAAGRLLVRIGYETSWVAYRQGTMVTLDRQMRVLHRRPATSGRGVAAIGETAVTFGATRLTATPEGGKPQALPELRLAQAWDLVALSDASLAPAAEVTAPAPAAGSGVVRAIRWRPPASTDDSARAVLGLLAAATAAAALAAAAGRARGPRQPNSP